MGPEWNVPPRRVFRVNRAGGAGVKGSAARAKSTRISLLSRNDLRETCPRRRSGVQTPVWPVALATSAAVAMILFSAVRRFFFTSPRGRPPDFARCT